MLVDPSRYRLVACALLVAALSGALGGGCQSEPEIRLEPIFPVDEPTLLTNAEVARLYVTAEPVGDTADKIDAPIQTSVEQGEAFALDLPEGSWTVKVKGVDLADSELVYGETRPFRVRRGKSETVRFFIGRTMAFNLVELNPSDIADDLADLVDHTATAFTDDDGRPFVLVAGGRRTLGGNDAPIAQALLIDAANHTVERLPALSCARAGHTAFTVQTSVGKRVVVAGGDADDDCSSTLDVYDPYSQSFTKLEACGLGTTRGATPELASVGAQAEQTGRVLVAGNPLCAVDVVSGFGEAGPVLESGATPDDAVAAGLNPLLGQALIVTPQGLFVERALAGDSCAIGGAWGEEAFWEWTELGPLRIGGRLANVNPLKTGGFLFVGGWGAGGDDPTYGWSYIVVNECRLSHVTEGEPSPAVLPAAGFAPVDLESETGEDINLLLTGGYDLGGEPLDRVALFHKPANSNIPTWHNLSLQSRQHPLVLKKPRAGHASALLPDGSHWIVGGGAAQPEIFVKGGGGLATDIQTLDRRNPTVSSMAVIDTAEPPAVDGGVPEPSMADDFAEQYPEAIYDQAAALTALVFLASTADRAVTDGLLDAELADPQGCSDPPGSIDGVVSGNVSGSGFDDDVFEVVPNSEWGSGGAANQAEEVAKGILAGLAEDENGCAWRQLLRVGLAGLTTAAEDAAADGIDLKVGINVMALVTADDDCSQGIYEGLGLEQSVPGDAVLADHHCTTSDADAMSAYDEYFGLPPVDPWDEPFNELIDGLAWEKSDLIVVVVGNTSEQELCTNEIYGGLRRPRRLLETLPVIGEAGAQTVSIDLCAATGEDELILGLDDLEEAVSARNPWQACIPGEVAGVDPPYDEAMQQYVPVPADDATAEAVSAAVQERCQLVYRAGESVDDRHFVSITVDPTEWRIGTNYDGRAEGCVGDVDEHLGWVLRTGQLKTSEEADAEDVAMAQTELVCVP